MDLRIRRILMTSSQPKAFQCTGKWQDGEWCEQGRKENTGKRLGGLIWP